MINIYQPVSGSPTTTQGDIIVRGASADARLAIGANATVLTSNGTTATWAAAAGGGLTIGTTTITSGTSTRLLFDAAGVVSETDGATWDATNKALTVGGATVTTSNPVLNMTQTWNAGAVTFTGIKLNVTNTASAAGSLLMDLQVGGTSALTMKKPGVVALTTSIPPASGMSLTSGVDTLYIAAGNQYVSSIWANYDLFLRANSAVGIGTPFTTPDTMIASPINPNGINISRRTIMFGRHAGISASTAYDNSILIQTHVSDDPTSSLKFQGQTALASAVTNIVGGSVFITAGSGASASSGLATGGSLYFVGGTGYGTGINGAIVLGSTDAAAPVAQTLAVQSVVAGTSNTAGVNCTIAGSRGTGTGTGGSIIFQTAPAGSTGSAQNALAAVLTLDSTKQADFAGHMQMTEITAPAAGAANTVRLYAEDNGSGKTRLMALFASGAAQQVAIEP